MLRLPSFSSTLVGLVLTLVLFGSTTLVAGSTAADEIVTLGGTTGPGLATGSSGGLWSPNGDGFAEKAEFNIIPGDPAIQLTSGSWSLLGYEGTRLIGPVALTAAQLAGSPFQIDPLARLGRRLPDGYYPVSVRLAGTLDGAPYSQTLSSYLYVWNTASLLGLATTTQTFYPVTGDNYEDCAFLNRNIPYSFVAQARVIGADGSVVYDSRETSATPELCWWGRDAGGSLLPEGQYYFELSVASGSERGTFVTPRFGLSHKRLVKRVWEKTFSARRSLYRDASGRCSRLVKHRSGAITYVSGWCGDNRASVARGVHQVRLPLATIPLRLRLGVTGRELPGGQALFRPLDRSGRGEIDYLLDGHVVDKGFQLDPRYIRPSGNLRWHLDAEGANSFRVRSFSLRYRYWVLV